ncbi:hypothetical protein RvY_14224 [Ramazzottius varieornatus]|uniref:Uncharacterized protein n=1 Tax=Ramazzottius varieornatus TaxID=947166 RepID=A0A1D1VQL5_RAMVA|nr:hypothetical protein RvY_14224 [Ramazzottius varieornatus]
MAYNVPRWIAHNSKFLLLTQHLTYFSRGTLYSSESAEPVKLSWDDARPCLKKQKPVRWQRRSQASNDQTSAGSDNAETRGYAIWIPGEEENLLQWIENPANYAPIKVAGKKSDLTGKMRTAGVSKAAVYRKVDEEGEMESSISVTYNESVPPEVDFSLPDLPEDDFRPATTQHVTSTPRSVNSTPQRKVSENPEKKVEESKTQQKSLSVAEALQASIKDQLAIAERKLARRKEVGAGTEDCRRRTGRASVTTAVRVR